MIKKRQNNKTSLFFRLFILTGCLIITCLIGFSTFALITKGNFDTFFGGRGVISDVPVPPQDRETIIITKDSRNVVIQSGYNYVFQGSEYFGTKDYPIHLDGIFSQIDIHQGVAQNPLDAYIDGDNNYFWINKSWNEGIQGVFGVLSGTIVNFNLMGIITHSETSVAMAAILEAEGILYNCNNYIDISSYDHNGYSAGLVGELKGKIIKCNNYGRITANGYASGIAYKITGSITGSSNYGNIISTSSKAAGIAGTVIGSVKDSQNLANVEGNLGAAGVAIEVTGGSLIGCINGSQNKKINIYSSSAYSVGIVYNLKSVDENTGKISKCINYSDINGNSGAAGIGYYINGNIEESHNYGDITSHSKAIGIARKVQGNITKTNNYGSVFGANDYSVGIVLEMEGDLVDCQNSGFISTSDGSASGIVYNIIGNITRAKNTGKVQKTGWGGDKYVTGIASIAYGVISDSINNGQVIVENVASYMGGIAGRMTGQILNSESNGKIKQNNPYMPVTIGGITAVLHSDAQLGTPLIKDCIVTGGLQIWSLLADKHIIAFSFPSDSIQNCVGMGKLYNL